MKSVILEDLLKDGFSEKFAKYYLNIRESEINNPIYDKELVNWAYANGFTAESVAALGINEQNKQEYYTDYEYYKLWPLNNWTRIWINDKLTLKYTLSKSGLDKYMPKYYYYMSPNGLRALMDNENKGNTMDDFIKELKDVKVFASKPCNGTGSAGFFRLSYENNIFYINGESCSEQGIINFVLAHPNYVFTEYLTPCKELKRWSDMIHTFRIVVTNETGNSPTVAGAYIRIPHEGSGAANYVFHDGTNNEKYNLYANYNVATGEYGNGIIVYPDRLIKTETHPDNGETMSGVLSFHKELKQAVYEISHWYNNVEYFGFDLCVTDDGVKLMEINTHPGIIILQHYLPIRKNKSLLSFFNHKMKEIDSLNEEKRKLRNAIPR